MRAPSAADELPNAPAAARNQAPLTEALRRLLPEHGSVLEVASGTGQHAAHWAGRFPGLDWQPSDGDPEAMRAIEAWRRAADHPNLRAPQLLDVGDPDWPSQVDSPFAAVVCVNLLHISPWPTTEQLLAGCSRVLQPGALLIIYGPFAEHGVLTPESNVAFDRSLRSRDPAWGIRDLDAVRETASQHGLELEDQVAMPANNRVLVIRNVGADGG